MKFKLLLFVMIAMVVFSVFYSNSTVRALTTNNLTVQQVEVFTQLFAKLRVFIDRLPLTNPIPTTLSSPSVSLSAAANPSDCTYTVSPSDNNINKYSTSASGVEAGDTVCFRGGTYNQQLNIQVSGSASGGYITFTNYPGEKPIIDMKGSAYDITGSNFSYVTINGFDLTGSSDFNGAINLSKVNHVDISNNYIHDNTSHAINIDGCSSDIYIGYNEAYHNGDDGISHGLERSDSCRYDNWIIEHNYLHDYVDTGAHADGIQWGGPSSNTIIRYNRISDFTQNYYIAPDCGTMVVEGMQIYGNISYNNWYGNGHNEWGKGIYLVATADVRKECPKGGFGSIKNAQVYNNTLGKHPFGWDLLVQGNTTNTVVKNNIFSNSMYGYTDVANEGSGTILSNNVYGEQHNPLFKNEAANDYHLTSNSPAIKAGANLGSSFSPDYDKIDRPTSGNWDIGAYEYIGTTQTCTSFNYSAWGTCQSNNTQTRTVTSSSPAGCTGGSPVLSQACTYVPPVNTCTSFNYSAWSPSVCPVSQTQTRTVTSSSPTGCTGGSPVTTQSCTYVPPANCTVATTVFQNKSFTSQNGTFTAEMDVTPSGSGADIVVGLGQASTMTQTNVYDQYASLVQFSNGSIKVRNGSTYGPATSYVAGISYHLKMMVNVPARTYSVTIKPAGGAEQSLASNFAFRSSQSSVNTLDRWGIVANPGVANACSFAITASANTCTSFNYSAWGACQSNNTQTRTVTSSSPAGCTGGSPVLSQACTYVPPATKPSITTQPQTQAIVQGQAVTFSVVVSSAAPVTYQWKKNSTNIPGATDSSYTIPSVKAGDAATYKVVVTNLAGSVTSTGAKLTVSVPTTNSCLEASTSWQNKTIATQTGVFTQQFDVTPKAGNLTTFVGLSQGLVSNENDLAAAIGFQGAGDDGEIVAFKGSSPSSDTKILYMTNKTYHFTMDINISARTYSVKVALEDGPTQNLATDYAFRTNATSLSNIGFSSKQGVGVGPATFCSLGLSTITPLSQVAAPVTAPVAVSSNWWQKLVEWFGF